MKKRILIAAIFCLISVLSFAQNETKRQTQFNLKGKKDLGSIYEGVNYYFSTVENKDAFAKSPMTYEPQYGGWCAFAMGDSGEKVEIDPATFKIVDGKLYLFYNAYFNNTLKSWNKDQSNLKAKADSNWKKFFK